MNIDLILAPVMGGIIGYITNDLAIKMLFRPRKAMYIGKLHIPFTPGLIPQQKSRIAQSIGKVISIQLLNAENLKQAFLSERTIRMLRDSIREKLELLAQNEQTVQSALELYLPPDEVRRYEKQLQERGTQFLMERILQADPGSILIENILRALQEKLAADLIASFLFSESSMREIKKSLSPRINNLVREMGTEIISDEIKRLEDDLMESRICDLYQNYQEHVPELEDRVIELYKTILDNNLEKLVAAVNIEQIVVDQIHNFDAVQLENMIFGIMKKELRAIVYLGAALGFLMGFINLLF